MLKFGMCCALACLMMCGGCSFHAKTPPETLVVTQVAEQEVPAVWTAEYDDPPEPAEQTWGALVEYILDQRAINAKHNEDKARIRAKR